MDLGGVLGTAFLLILDWQVLLAIALGGALGYLAGAIPGLGSATVIAIALPILVLLPTLPAIVFIAGVYGAAEAGGAVPAVLFNIPGTPGSGASALEGYPLAQRGHAALAIVISVLASVLGATLGGVVAVLVLHFAGRAALLIGPVELFAFGVLGVTSTASLGSGGRLSRGIISAAFGGLLGLVGSHEIYVLSRATLNVPALYDGLPLLAVVLGVFGISEALHRVVAPNGSGARGPMDADAFSPKFILQTAMSAIRVIASRGRAVIQGLITGFILGIVPGTGAAAAAYVSYGYARAMSRAPEEYGKGSTEGLVATEVANNAVVPGSLIPLFVLGVPGSIVSGLMLTVLMIHGLSPGPAFMSQFEVMGIAVIIGSILGLFAAAACGLLLGNALARLIHIPTGIFVASVLTLSLLGAFSERNIVADMLTALVFGVIGLLMKLANWPIAPFLIAFLLMPIVERGLLRTLLIGGPELLLQRPIGIGILILAGMLLVLPAIMSRRRGKATINVIGSRSGA